MTRASRTLFLLLGVFALSFAGCKPKKKEARHYVEASNPSEKKKLEAGQAYTGKDGKVYTPVASLKLAPPATPAAKKARAQLRPYQSVDGKYYYFPSSAHSELGISASKAKPKTPVQKVKNQTITPEDRAQVVATVNGEKITVGELYDKINSRPPAWRRIFAKKEKKLEFLNNQIIVEKLLHDAALKANIKQDPVVEEAAKKRMVDLLRREHINKIRKTVKVTDADMKKYYDENKSQFNQPEGMIAAHILVKTKAEADAIHKELTAGTRNSGRKWRALVTKHSIDAVSKAKGGLLGTPKHRVVSQNDTHFEKPLVEAIWKLAKNGDISAPVKTSKGWHVVKRYNKRKALNISYAQAKRRLKRLVERQAVNKAYKAWIAELKKKYAVKTFPENVKLVEVKIEAPKAPAKKTAAPKKPAPKAAMK